MLNNEAQELNNKARESEKTSYKSDTSRNNPIKTQILKINDITTAELKKYFASYPVAIPTETVYGLASSISNIKTTQMIYKIKNRPAVNPLILHVVSREMLEKYVEFVPQVYEPLIKKYWPGPLSLIFKANDFTKNIIDSEYVCIRMPVHETAQKVIHALNEGVFAPSANVSGRISPTTSKHVFDEFDGKIELIIEGGKCEFGLESSIFDYRSLTVLRPGRVTFEEIQQVIEENQMNFTNILNNSTNITNNSKKAVLCPGTMFKHYSPDCSLHLFNNESELDSILKEIKNEPKYRKIGILHIKELVISKEFNDFMRYKHTDYNNIGNRRESNYREIIEFSLGSTNSEISYNLYDFLRMADSVCDILICETVEKKGSGMAIMDRLERAAEK